MTGGGSLVAAAPGTKFVPQEWKFLEARKPESKRARERKFGQDHIGTFAPGSELAPQQKGCEP